MPTNLKKLFSIRVPFYWSLCVTNQPRLRHTHKNVLCRQRVGVDWRLEQMDGMAHTAHRQLFCTSPSALGKSATLVERWKTALTGIIGGAVASPWYSSILFRQQQRRTVLVLVQSTASCRLGPTVQHSLLVCCHTRPNYCCCIYNPIPLHPAVSHQIIK